MIVMKTDASYKSEVGAGISFYVEIKEGGVTKERIKDYKFLSGVKKSTDAELLAVLYGVKNIVNHINEKDKYILRMNSDCEYIERVFEKPKYKNKPIRRMIVNLVEGFIDWKINWIPRATNQQADALARCALNNHESDYV